MQGLDLHHGLFSLLSAAPDDPRPPEDPGEPGTGIDLEDRQETNTPRRFKVLLHNDDYTTVDFVIHILRSHFSMSHAEALHCTLQVHHHGQGVAGVFSRDVAETKVQEVTREARDAGMPLKTTAEPE